MREHLTRHLSGGPVIHDPRGRRYYALVPPGTAARWPAPFVDCLGTGTYLGVPPDHRTDVDETTRSPYWAAPVIRPGVLCSVADVLALVIIGACLSDEDES